MNLGLPVLLEAFGMRAALPLLMRTLPLDRVLATITPRTRDQIPPPRALERIEEVTDLVTRRLRPTRTACLKRAMMRYRLLCQQGHPARFVIGVRQGGEDGFQAHAWVELDGAPVMEREPVDYRRTFVWPRTG